MHRTKRMWRRLGLGLLFGAAIGGIASAQGSDRFDGQYMGELILTKVVINDCTQPPLGAMYPLTIANGSVRFIYAPRFATTLIGKVDDRGMFKAGARLRR